MSRVVVIGSANVDHVVLVPRLPAEGETVEASAYLNAAGGKGLNQAVAAARQGADVALIACVGDDAGGDGLVALLGAEGIDSRRVRKLAAEGTGLALVTVAPGGTNTVVVAPQANSRLNATHVEASAESLDAAAVVLAQLEVPMVAVERALVRGRAAGATTMLNAAPAVGLLPRRMPDLVDVLVVNETEASALTGLAPDRAGPALVDQGYATVITTLGRRGTLVTNADGVTALAPFKVEAVDSTAAGDALCGTLAAGLAAGLPLVDALERAMAAGALAATIAGAVPSLPTAAAVDAVLRAQPTEGRRRATGDGGEGGVR